MPEYVTASSSSGVEPGEAKSVVGGLGLGGKMTAMIVFVWAVSLWFVMPIQ